MNCAGVRETLPAFALGVAPPPDVSSIELHVETCAACRKEAIDLQRAVTAFGYALAPVEPAAPSSRTGWSPRCGRPPAPAPAAVRNATSGQA